MTILCSTDEQGRPTLNGKLRQHSSLPAGGCHVTSRPSSAAMTPRHGLNPLPRSHKKLFLLEAAFTRHFVIAVRKGISTVGNQDHTARQLAPGCLLHSHSSPIRSHFFPSQEQAPTFMIFISEPLILLNYPFLGSPITH